jgi:GAF domain-containing protein
MGLEINRASLNPARWLAGQTAAFQAAMNGASLASSLDILIETAIAQTETHRRCAFYILGPDGGLHHVVGMLPSYADRVDGFKVGTDSLACGLAVGTNRPVITPDVFQEPKWRPWLGLAIDYGYRGCWSFPVETATGKVVGSFAMYFDNTSHPTDHDRLLAAALCNTASIIIAHHLELEERERLRRLLSLAMSSRSARTG